MEVEETLRCNAERAQSQSLVVDLRADQLTSDGLQPLVVRTDALVDKVVEDFRGLDHFLRHELAEPGRTTFIEESGQEEIHVSVQTFFGSGCAGQLAV